MNHFTRIALTQLSQRPTQIGDAFFSRRIDDGEIDDQGRGDEQVQ